MAENKKVKPQVETEEVEVTSKEEEQVQPEVETTQEKSEPEIIEQEPVEEIIADETVAPSAQPAADATVKKAVYYAVEPENPVLDDEATKKNLDNLFLDFSSKYKKTRRIQTIMFAVTLVLFIGAIVLVFLNNKSLQPLLYVVLGVAIVAFVVTMVINSKFKKQTYVNVDKYISDYLSSVNRHTLSFDGLKDVQSATNGKVNNQEIINAHYFETILSINSRNNIIGTYLDNSFSISEVALRIPDTNPSTSRKSNDVIGFFGKFINYNYPLKNGAVIIVRQSDTDTVTALPSYLDGYELIDVPGLESHYLVYSTSAEATEELFSQEVIQKITEMPVDEDLMDFFISANATGIQVALNYSDNAMNIPIEKPVLVNTVKHYKDIELVFDLLKTIVKE